MRLHVGDPVTGPHSHENAEVQSLHADDWHAPVLDWSWAASRRSSTRIRRGFVGRGGAGSRAVGLSRLSAVVFLIARLIWLSSVLKKSAVNRATALGTVIRRPFSSALRALMHGLDTPIRRSTETLLRKSRQRLGPAETISGSKSRRTNDS